MGTPFYPNMTPDQGRGKRRVLSAILFMLCVLVPAQAFADQTGAVWRSLLLPGAGQAHKGHYKKAAAFAGATVLSATGLLLSHVYYTQAVDRYNDLKTEYAGYESTLAGGGIVSSDDLTRTYSEMESAWNDSEDRLLWRQIFTAALLTTYALNVVDVLLTDPHEIDPDEPRQARFMLEADDTNVRVTARFGF
jgi:hypothetical protein